MKKTLVGIVLCLIMATSAFADFLLEAPSVGYSNFLFNGVGGDSYKADVLTINFPGMGFQRHNESGFYFMWNNQLAVAGKQNLYDKPIHGDYSYNNLLALGGKSDFIFGGSIVPIENFCITLGSGLSSGYQSGTVFIGIPLDLSVKYYFTEKVGIMLGLNDTLACGFNVGRMWANDTLSFSFINFTNQFNIRLGPAFRF